MFQDFVSGKVNYCYPPPDDTNSVESSETGLSVSKTHKMALPAVENSVIKNTALEARLDAQFFAPVSKIHQKGKLALGANTSEKPSKKHFNRNKKEKLRRVYKQLDADEY